jgi:hypothetical protein
MKITEVTYGYRFGRQNYSSENIELTARVDEGEDGTLELLKLRHQVMVLGGTDEQIEVAKNHIDLHQRWMELHKDE